MPFYDFKCPECKTVIEHKRKIKDKDLPAKCECGHLMKRLFPTSVTMTIDMHQFNDSFRKPTHLSSDEILDA